MARFNTLISSLKLPIPVLQAKHTYPLISPVSWLWSSTTDVLFKTGLLFLQIGQRNETPIIGLGFFLMNSFFALVGIGFFHWRQTLHSPLLTSLSPAWIWLISNSILFFRTPQLLHFFLYSGSFLLPLSYPPFNTTQSLFGQTNVIQINFATNEIAI